MEEDFSTVRVQPMTNFLIGNFLTCSVVWYFASVFNGFFEGADQLQKFNKSQVLTIGNTSLKEVVVNTSADPPTKSQPALPDYAAFLAVHRIVAVIRCVIQKGNNVLSCFVRRIPLINLWYSSTEL